MENRETMLEVILQAYAARGRGELEGLLAAFHPEGVFTLVGDAKSLQIAGTVQGHRSLGRPLMGSLPLSNSLTAKS